MASPTKLLERPLLRTGGRSVFRACLRNEAGCGLARRTANLPQTHESRRVGSSPAPRPASLVEAIAGELALERNRTKIELVVNGLHLPEVKHDPRNTDGVDPR